VADPQPFGLTLTWSAMTPVPGATGGAPPGRLVTHGSGLAGGPADNRSGKEIQRMQATEEFLTEWAAAEQAGDTGTLEMLLADGFTVADSLGSSSPSRRGWPVTVHATSPIRTSASMRFTAARSARTPWW
jgi:hypothetical protein